MWQIMTSEQLNAPIMQDVNGQLLGVLDACLINGFNEQTASHYASGVLTFGGVHGYIKNQHITISDSTGQGNYKIKEVSENQVILYEKPILQGQITTKITPLGWESIFGDDDPLRRAYRSKNDKSSKTVLFLDMTYPQNHGYHATNPARRAMVTMCEDMTNLGVPINDYTATINNKPANPNGALFIHQARNYSKTDRVVRTTPSQWVVCGDDSMFILMNNHSQTGTIMSAYIFGDFEPLERECVGFWGSISNNDQAPNNNVRLHETFGVLITGERFNFNLFGHIYSGHSGFDYGNVLVSFPTYVVSDKTIMGRIPHFYNFNQNISRAGLENTWVGDVYLVRAGSSGAGADSATIWGVGDGSLFTP